MRYILGCSLSYNILSDTTFIFNLEVAKLKSVEILTESLVLTPNLKRDLYNTRPTTRTAISRSTCRPASSRWSTMPRSIFTVHRADPATINETPIGQLPLDILPFLLPSRFVSSDRLTPFALAEFGALPRAMAA